MDLDLGFVVKLLAEGDEGYRVAKERRVRESYFEGPAVKAWGLICEHEKKHGKLPTIEILAQKLGLEKIENVPDVEKAIVSELIELLEERYIHKRMTSIIDEAKQLAEKYKGSEARALLSKKMNELNDEGVGTGDTVMAVSELAEAVIERYEKVERGEIGIPTPWAALDEVTLGWQPEDVAVFVARMGVGKSWTLLLCGLAAWKAGYKVIVVTTEMAQIALALRFFSAFFKVSYGDLRKARLGFGKQQFFENLRSFDDEGRFKFAGGSMVVDVQSIELIVEQERPDLLIVDGLYLVQDSLASKNVDRMTRVGNTIEWMKGFAKRKKLPILTSTQFNRKVVETKEESADSSKIGLSDLIGWCADYVIAAIQTPKMRSMRLMKFKTLKVREDTRILLTTNWDFEYMDFSEREVEREGEEVVEDDAPTNEKSPPKKDAESAKRAVSDVPL